MDYRRVHQMIEAASAASTLQNMKNFSGFAPAKESHVRALMRLEKDDDRASVL